MTHFDLADGSGADPARERHDRDWAARGVQVVRHGTASSPAPKGAPHLLLEPKQIVNFDAARAVRRLARGGRATVRVVLSAHAAQRCRERVVADGDRLVRLEREYDEPDESRTSVLLTRDARLVRTWGAGAPRPGRGRWPHVAGPGDAAASVPRRPGKRVFDIVFSLLVLVATAPLCALIALAIWLEDGRPIFFAHRRQTRGGREFVCYKFRTMWRDADTMKKRFAGENQCDGPHFNITHDPRLLRTGRLLRRFHLDEMPQFLNVLLGHMQVVGPRPSPERENRYCPAWREARLAVRPGITGLWQVRRTRAPHLDFQEWIRYDLEYIERQCWRLDLWIIIETVRKTLRRRRDKPSA